MMMMMMMMIMKVMMKMMMTRKKLRNNNIQLWPPNNQKSPFESVQLMLMPLPPGYPIIDDVEGYLGCGPIAVVPFKRAHVVPSYLHKSP